MTSPFPTEIWRQIIGLATYPDDFASLNEDVRQIAQVFDPDSLGDQYRFPWRKEFKHPVDTVTSLRTKLSLVQVSRLFHDLSLEFLYETIYLRHRDGIQARSTQELARIYSREQTDDHPTIGKWTQYIHVFVDGDTQGQWDSWIDAVITILQHSTSLQGFVQVNKFGKKAIFAQYSVSILNAIPSCITHLEWISPDFGIRSDNTGTNNIGTAIFQLLLRARALCALRLHANYVEIPDQLGHGMVMPNIKYMDVCGGVIHLNFWTKFPSLSHLAFRGGFVHWAFVPLLWGFPELSHLCHFQTNVFSGRSEIMGSLIRASPTLLKVTYVCEITVNVLDYWGPIQSHSLQSIELHLSNNLMDARERPEEEVLVAKFISMREHLRPLASVVNFPALTDLRIYGLHKIVLVSEQLRPRLVELANSSLVDLLIARDVQVSVFD